jgi:hypothetical protein
LQIKHVHVKSFCLMSLILTSISYL